MYNERVGVFRVKRAGWMSSFLFKHLGAPETTLEDRSLLLISRLRSVAAMLLSRYELQAGDASMLGVTAQ